MHYFSMSSNCKCKNTEVYLSMRIYSYLTRKSTAHPLWWLNVRCHAFHWLVTIQGHDNNLTLRNSLLFVYLYISQRLLWGKTNIFILKNAICCVRKKSMLITSMMGTWMCFMHLMDLCKSRLRLQGGDRQTSWALTTWCFKQLRIIQNKLAPFSTQHLFLILGNSILVSICSVPKAGELYLVLVSLSSLETSPNLIPSSHQVSLSPAP